LKVTPRGQIILLDFGLAKGNPTDAGNKTAAKSIFGYSRNYASLEQIQGTGTDPRSDLYSLAATLYHLMTGVAPEDALTRAMAVLSQQPDPLVPAASLRPDIPLGVSAILTKALDLNASTRPASAAEMRAMLRHHEKFAHAAPISLPAIARPTESALLAHATNVHPETTWAAIAGSDAVTELMPDTKSQITSVRPANLADAHVAAAGTTSAKSGKIRKLAFAAVFVVMGICVAAAGFFAYEKGLWGTDEPVNEQPVAADIAPPPEATTDLTDGSTVFESSTEAESGSKEVPAAPPKDSTASKPTSGRPPTAAKSTAPDDPGMGDKDVVITDDSMKAGNVMTRRGKIVTPEEEFDRNFPQRRVPPNVPRAGYPVDPRNLTPAQRRRLRILRQNHPERFAKPTPYR
jgi:hypothetical protein